MPIWFKFTIAAVCFGLGFLFQLSPVGRQIASYLGAMFVAAQTLALAGYGVESLLRREVSVAGVALGAIAGLILGAFLAPYAVRYGWVYWGVLAIAVLFVLSWFTLPL